MECASRRRLVLDDDVGGDRARESKPNNRNRRGLSIVPYKCIIPLFFCFNICVVNCIYRLLLHPQARPGRRVNVRTNNDNSSCQLSLLLLCAAAAACTAFLNRYFDYLHLCFCCLPPLPLSTKQTRTAILRARLAISTTSGLQ